MENNTDKYIGMMLDDRYEILELIGTGGMANVYKAMCHRLHRYDAIKIMRDEAAKNEEFRRRFRTESQAIAMLSHPNIVSVYDVSHNDDVEYIVMELIEGITLKQHMQKTGTLSLSETISFSLQIANALAHAHDKGIIHRDIKPQNIMLLNDGMIKVADFGIAAMQSGNFVPTDETVGSVHYIAPEQARGLAPDARSDIYSLGIMMYEMLTGKLPYTGDTAMEIAVKHMNTDPAAPTELNPEIPAELERITLKAMATEINERYQSAQELIADLEAFNKQLLAEEVSSNSAADDELKPISRAGELSKAEYKKKKKRARKVAFNSGLFAVLIFIIVVFVFINGYFLKDLFGNPEPVTIPSFVGRYYEDVINDKDYSKVFSFNLTFRVDTDSAYGIIVSQSPEADRTHTAEDSGIKVELVVSSGEAVETEKPIKTVPDVSNKELESAVIEIKNAGFEYVTADIPSDSITVGFVIGTEPAGGEAAEEGSTVRISVSSGPEIKTVLVPQLKGLSKDAAIARIEEKGLSIGTISVVESELEEGTVVWQSKEVGEEVDQHTKIYLQISAGPKEEEKTP